MATAGISGLTSYDAHKTTPGASRFRPARKAADCRADLELMLRPLRDAALAVDSGDPDRDEWDGRPPQVVTATLEMLLSTDIGQPIAEQAAEQLIVALQDLVEQAPAVRAYVQKWAANFAAQ